MKNMLGNEARILSLIMLLVFSCILTIAPVFAEDAGDGSGGGQGVPLGLDYSSPADGQKDVSLSGDIKLTFNKNVIYLTVRENNKKCFSLIAADGSKVPIEVIMADDQINPEEKRNITIHPLQALKPGTAYTLKISPELQAKNGASLGYEETVSFVTEGMAAQPTPIAPETEKPAAVKVEPAGEKKELPQAAVEEPKEAVEENTPEEEDKSQQIQDKQGETEEKNPVKENPPTEQKPNRTYAIIAGASLIAGAGYLLARKRMHK